MNKVRLDHELVRRGLVATRSQAESYIKLGYVEVDGIKQNKPGFAVSPTSNIHMTAKEQFVGRAGLKLASVADSLGVMFKDKIVLDVGSSTGGFTDFALRRGAKKVFAVDVGSNQLHPSLRDDSRIELHEQTDIRDFNTNEKIDVVMADVSFISLKEILPYIAKLMSKDSLLIAMVKPQFEAGKSDVHKGVIKNEKIRRNTLKDFENWVQKLYIIVGKADSQIKGEKGNRERFYLLRKV